jgi:hypothetical protein
VADFDLDEKVVYGGREVPLRRALSEYAGAKQAGGAGLTGPLCFRQYGKMPAWLDGAQMEKLIALI